MIIVLMGVSGSGKTTVGRILADQLGWPFLDADDFHPPANVAKMHSGQPLTDEDRLPWLEALRRRIDDACDRAEDVILACSALKHDYRDYLRHDAPACVRFVYLSGSEEQIRERLSHREGHFMPPELLHSQITTLEPPRDSVQVDISAAPAVIAEKIRQALGV